MPPRGKLLGPELEAEIRKCVREERSRVRNPNAGHRRTWWRRGEEGGSVHRELRFQIVSGDAETRSANVLIEELSWSINRETTVIPGGLLGPDPSNPEIGATNLIVYDPDGCYLNEPNVRLIGRFGKAVYYGFGPLSEPNNAGLYDPDEPQHKWYVSDLCCGPIGCSG